VSAEVHDVLPIHPRYLWPPGHLGVAYELALGKVEVKAESRTLRLEEPQDGVDDSGRR
jgi:hypothetical protein